MLITAIPQMAPITTDMPPMIASGMVLKICNLAMRLIANGVSTTEGIYVGHSGMVMTPKNAMPRMATGLTEPPHRSGFQQTKVVTAATGATIVMTSMLRTTRMALHCRTNKVSDSHWQRARDCNHSDVSLVTVKTAALSGCSLHR